MYHSSLTNIAHTILNESSSEEALRNALDEFSRLCSEVTGIRPDPTFDAWAEDAFLENGVAINPQAAALCLHDYRRSIAFIRGLYAAINSAKARFVGEQLTLLYAGCGPFATLVLPLLTMFESADLDIYLLDVHSHSLRSVQKLIDFFGLTHHEIKLIEADATRYQHDQKLHVIIAEVMQKALEQEPQFAVTANLSTQLLPDGIFLPQLIEIDLCLADLVEEKAMFQQQGFIDEKTLNYMGKRVPICQLMQLSPAYAEDQLGSIDNSQNGGTIPLKTFTLPSVTAPLPDVLMVTRICVFESHVIESYEAEITLPYKCPDLMPQETPIRYQASYRLGRYPIFEFAKLSIK